MKLLRIIVLFGCLSVYHTLFSQDVKFIGIFQSYTQHCYFKKWDWVFNFSNLINPKDLKFDQLDYPARDIRLQIVNIIHYSVQPNLRIGIGHHYQRNFPFDSRATTEFRPFEQVEYDHWIGKVKITHMVRFNQRFAEQKSTQSYPLSLTIQYKKQFKYIFRSIQNSHKNYYLAGYSEEYLTLSGPLLYKAFSEYWSYLCIGYQWNKKLKLEAGLGYEYLVRNSNFDLRNILYPSINLVSLLDWRK